MKKILLLMIIMLLSSTLVSCKGNEEKKDLEKVTFVLDWFPNTNHTGIYVAKEKGYYEEMGLDVEIIQPGGSTADVLVASNSAQFGISYQEGVTLARAEGLPIVSIAAVIQENTSGFGSLKSKNIISPKDFENKKYGGWGSPIEIATIKNLMDKYGADFSTVEIVTIGDMDFFAASEMNEIDFAWIFEGWTKVEASLKEKELNYISLGKEDEVFNYYTPVIITNEDNIKMKRELVEKFMEATVKGYEYAIENPKIAADIFTKQVPELDFELVKRSQIFLSDKYKGNSEIWGYQDSKIWENYTNWLVENGFISTIDISDAYTNEFIK